RDSGGASGRAAAPPGRGPSARGFHAHARRGRRIPASRRAPLVPVRPEAEDPRSESDETLSGADPPDDPEAGPALPSAALASRATRPAPVRTGTLPQTEREIWALAWPVILSQVLASIVSLVDMGMVGRLGREAQAAVTYTSQFQNLAQSILFAVGT